MKKLNRQLKNIPTAVKVVAGLIVGFIVWKIFRGGKKLSLDISNAIKNDQQVAAINNVSQSTGISGERAQEVINIAKDVFEAFHKTFFGLGEDEEKAVNALNRAQSSAEAKASAVVYRTNYSKSMYDDFKQYSGTFIDPWPKQAYMDAIKGL